MAIDAHLAGSSVEEPVDVKLKLHPEIRDLIKRIARIRSIRMGDVVTQLVCAGQGVDHAPYIPSGQTEARREDAGSGPTPAPTSKADATSAHHRDDEGPSPASSPPDDVDQDEGA